MSERCTKPRLWLDRYSGLIQDVLRNGQVVAGVRDAASVGSNFGHKDRPYREILGAELRLPSSPVTLLSSPSRRSDPIYAQANLLWALSGSDRAIDIAYYNSRAEAFTDDGEKLAGAVGPRVAGGHELLKGVIDRLRRDLSSRRAVIPLLYPTDLLTGQRDFPCALAIQFLVRDGAVDAVGFMRSQSALMVLPYDLVLFTGLQQLVADELGLRVGRYVHMMSSCHLYEDEVALAETVLVDPPTPLEYLPMSGGLSSALATIAFERRLRAAVVNTHVARVEDDVEDATQSEADDYWAEARLILLYKAATVLKLNSALEQVESRMRAPLRESLHRRG